MRVTLLGYKTTGRGSTVTVQPYNWWLDVINDLEKNHKCPIIGIDTCMVEQFEKQLKDQKVPDYLITNKEGKFSCYIDAVDYRMGPSSYCEDNQFTKLDYTKGFNPKQKNITDQIVDQYLQY